MSELASAPIAPGDRVRWHRQRTRGAAVYIGVVQEIKQQDSYVYAVVAIEPGGWIARPSINRLERIDSDVAVPAIGAQRAPRQSEEEATPPSVQAGRVGHMEATSFGFSPLLRSGSVTSLSGEKTKNEAKAENRRKAHEREGGEKLVAAKLGSPLGPQAYGDDQTEDAKPFTLWTPPISPVAAATSAEVLIAQLSDREAEVLRLVAMGMGNQAIADRLTISERAVRTHVSNILSKLDLQNRTQATLLAMDSGLADGRIVKAYLERNGESLPPQTTGGFWMEIPEPLERDHILIARAPWGEWRMRRSNGKWEPYLPHRLRQAKARFWGPIGTPWDK